MNQEILGSPRTSVVPMRLPSLPLGAGAVPPGRRLPGGPLAGGGAPRSYEGSPRISLGFL